MKVVLCLLLIGLGIHSPMLAQDISGRVITVFSGDRIEIIDERAMGDGPKQVRLYGIDAPEIGQSFGDDAQKQLQDWCLNASIRLEVVHTDSDGVLVGRVHFEAEDINLKMIQFGLAWWDQERAPDLDDYSSAEQQAQAEQRGLWQDESPVAPWLFRHAQLATRSMLGWAFGMGSTRVGWHTDDGAIVGWGGGLEASYGLTESFGVHLRANLGAFPDIDFSVLHLDLGGTYSFLNGNVRPMLEGALSWRAMLLDSREGFILGPDGRVIATSMDPSEGRLAASGGGGILYFVNPQIAIDVRVLVSLGRHSDSRYYYEGNRRLEEKTQFNVRTLRGQIGVRWYPRS